MNIKRAGDWQELARHSVPSRAHAALAVTLAGGLALARRLAVIMHRIWIDGTEFRWTRESATTAA